MKLIQRFGSALNLNIHFHMLFLDGVYTGGSDGCTTWFRRVKAPTGAELTRLVHTIANRVVRHLERQGLLVRDAESSYLSIDPDSPMNHLLGSSVTYRIAVGPQQGRKVFTLQTLPDLEDQPFGCAVGDAEGFSLHAGVAVRAHERRKLEHLCRYIARPAVSIDRLSLTRNGRLRSVVSQRLIEQKQLLIKSVLKFIGNCFTKQLIHRDSLKQGESGDSLLNPHSSAKTGRPLGSEKFIETLESLTGRPLKRRKPGRKPFE